MTMANDAQQSIFARIISVAVFASMITSCSLLSLSDKVPKTEETEPAAENHAAIPASSDDTYHTVRWGDTLSQIAKWYTGNLHHWRILARANPALIPDQLQPGDRIRIPAAYRVRRDTMPLDFEIAQPAHPNHTQPEKSPEAVPVTESTGEPAADQPNTAPGPVGETSNDTTEPAPRESTTPPLLDLFGPMEL